MKKTVFVDEVCRALYSFGVDEAMLASQRLRVTAYLTSLGIGEVSAELDDESPLEFAEEIYEVLAQKGLVSSPAQKLLKNNEAVRNKNSYSEDNEEDVKIFAATSAPHDNVQSQYEAEISVKASEAMPSIDDFVVSGSSVDESSDEESQFYDAEDSYANRDETYEEDFGATHVFNAAHPEDAFPREETSQEYTYSEYDDYQYSDDYESDDEYEQEYTYNDDDIPEPVGNPIWFWVLFGLCSPFLLAGAIATLALYGLGYAVILLFKVAYVPMIVVTIFGGSALTLAELIYSFIKISGENTAVGFFEFGICLCVAALTVGFSALTYYLGTKVMPTAFKEYRRLFKFGLRKIRRAFKRAKGVCSV